MAERLSPAITYACQLCKAQCSEHPDRPRALLLLCGECFDKRFAKGLADQRRVAGNA